MKKSVLVRRLLLLGLVCLCAGAVWYFLLATPIAAQPSQRTQTAPGVTAQAAQNQYPPSARSIEVIFRSQRPDTLSLPPSAQLERLEGEVWMALRPLPLPGRRAVPALEHLLEPGGSVTIPYGLGDWCRRLSPGRYRLAIAVEDAFVHAEFQVAA